MRHRLENTRYSSRTVPKQLALLPWAVNGHEGSVATHSSDERLVASPGPGSVATELGGKHGWAACEGLRGDGGVQREGNFGSQSPEAGGVSRQLTDYCPSPSKQLNLHEQDIAHLRLKPEPAKPALASPIALDGLASGYVVRARLRPEVADRRVAKCGCIVYGDPSVVTTEYADGSRKARWSGVILCNRAGCPVCGAIRARRFGEKVKRTLGSGGLWQHVTLTVPHTREDTWSQVYDRALAGVRDMTKGKAGKVLRGIQLATIRATESTWSARNGWHVHFHCLWQLRRPLMSAELDVLQEQWAARTGAKKDRGLRLGKGFNTAYADQREQAGKYVSKLSLELSGAAKEAHEEHWTIGEIFQRAASDLTHDERMFLDLVDEYQASTKGRRIYQLDRRAMRIHNEAPELPEQTIVNEWRTSVWREEFSGLSRVERHKRVWDAIYLPLEAAAMARGDPAAAIGDTIEALLQRYDQRDPNTGLGAELRLQQERE